MAHESFGFGVLKMANAPAQTAIPERRLLETSIRELYEWKPYPALGDYPKNTGRWIKPIRHLLPAGKVRYLDAGCGTGHSIVGLAREYPNWDYYAVDICRASLDIAEQLARKFTVKIQFKQCSYLDPLPFAGPFDVIACFGSIVVCEDPIRAVRNLLSYLSENGLLMLWLYCKRGHEPRMITKEILDILEPDVFNHTRRFELYRELRKKQRSPWAFFLDASPRRLWRAIRTRLQSGTYRRQSFAYNYREPDQLWADNFCLPFEHHYSVSDVKALSEAAELDVFLLTGQGREDLNRLPTGWLNAYQRLNQWSKWRLMELLDYDRPRSMEVYGRRRRTNQQV